MYVRVTWCVDVLSIILFLVFVFLLLVVVCQNISNWNHQSTRNTGNWFTWCVWHIQSDFEILHLLILMVGKEDGKKEGNLVRSGRYFILHFSFTFLTSFVGFIVHPYWMPSIGM